MALSLEVNTMDMNTVALYCAFVAMVAGTIIGGATGALNTTVATDAFIALVSGFIALHAPSPTQQRVINALAEKLPSSEAK